MKTVLKFSAEWCGPCKNMARLIEEIKPELVDVEVIEVNIDEETDLVNKYAIRNIPTLILLKDESVLDRMTGTVSKENLLKFINQ